MVDSNIKKEHTKNFFDKMVITGGAGLKPKNTLKKVVKRFLFKILKTFLPKDRLKRFYSSDYNSLSPIMQKSFVSVVNEHLDYCLQAIENKTFLVFGKNDKETPLYMAKKFNKNIKNSTLLVVEDAGHFCFVEKPALFNFAVKEFLLKKE